MTEKARARYLVQKAVKAGTLARRPCEVCGTTEKLHAHHDDYSNPLEVRWLCGSHHAKEHYKAIATLKEQRQEEEKRVWKLANRLANEQLERNMLYEVSRMLQRENQVAVR
jgi:hypothetical protein